MRNKRFPNYPDDTDYNTNSPSYYDDLARKQKLIELLAKKIWEYEETLDLTLEEISNRLELYIEENDDLMRDRLNQWDLNLEKFPENVELLLQEWLSDGTLDHIINDTIFNWKLDTSIFEQFKLTTNQQLQKMAKIYTIKPTQTDNDSTNINNIIADGGDFYFEAGVYNIQENIDVKSNTTLTFSKGAIFQKTPVDSSVYYNVISVLNCENIEINNPVIIGDRENHIGTGLEHGHGMSIRNSDNITVNNANIKDCWGDGIYIGHSYGEVIRKNGKIIIESPTIDNVRRNGISVCGGKRIVINSATIKNINGTSPMAGIDIEPEGTGAVSPFLDHLTINDLKTENCKGSGLQLSIHHLSNSNLKTDITVNNHTSVNDYLSTFITPLSGKLIGSINFNHSVSIGSKRTAIYMEEYAASNTPKVTFEKPVIINFNTDNRNVDWYNGALTVIRLPESINTYDIGNVDFIEPYIQRDESFSTFHGRNLYFNDTTKENTGIKNVRVLNPLSINRMGVSSDLSSLIVNSDDVYISDLYKVLSQSVKTRTIKYNDLYLHYNNKGKEWASITLESAPENIEIEFEVIDGTQMSIFPPANGNIQPLFPNGGNAGTNVIGSRLVLKKVANNWHIVEKIGSWGEV